MLNYLFIFDTQRDCNLGHCWNEIKIARGNISSTHLENESWKRNLNLMWYTDNFEIQDWARLHPRILSPTPLVKFRTISTVNGDFSSWITRFVRSSIKFCERSQLIWSIMVCGPFDVCPLREWWLRDNWIEGLVTGRDFPDCFILKRCFAERILRLVSLGVGIIMVSAINTSERCVAGRRLRVVSLWVCSTWIQPHTNLSDLWQKWGTVLWHLDLASHPSAGQH